MTSQEYINNMTEVLKYKEKKSNRYNEVVEVVKSLMLQGKPSTIKAIMNETGIKHYSQIYLMVKDSETKGKALKKVVINGNTLIIAE